MAKEMKTVKKLVEIEVEEAVQSEEGAFDALLGKTVLILCMNYFYTGKLVVTNGNYVILEDPKIVYETGEWSATSYKDAQKLPMKRLRVMVSAIEAIG